MGTPQQSQAPGAPGFDMNAMLAAFAQMQQQQQAGQLQSQQNYFDNTNPLGRVGMSNARPAGLTPGSEWSAMFGDNAASAMTPEARMASQGRSATNQWAQLGGVPNVDPTKLQALMTQRTPTPGVAPIDSVDQFSDPKFLPRINQQFGFTPRTDLPGTPTRAIPGGFEGMINPQAKNPFSDANTFSVSSKVSLPKGVVAGDGTTNYTRSKPKRKGSSFGMQPTSPKPGFSF